MQPLCALTNAGVQLTLAVKCTESAASVNIVKWLLLFFSNFSLVVILVGF